jgi:hypothetical protein
MDENVQMFVNTCDSIIKGNLSTQFLIPTKAPYHGRIVP